MDLSQIVAMKARKKIKSMNQSIVASNENILQATSGSNYSTVHDRLTALESNLLSSATARLSTLTASNAIILNETLLMLSTISNFNDQRTELTKLLYDGLENNTSFDFTSSTDSTYQSGSKQVNVNANGELIFQAIDCGTSVSMACVSLGTLSGSFQISIRRNASSSWMVVSENEWIDLSAQNAGTSLEIKLNCTTASVLNGFSVCWL